VTPDRRSAGWAALVARSGNAPERTAFRFTDESGRVASDVTYTDLDARARAVAARLSRDRVTAPVMLLFPTGVEFLGALFGCLYAGVPAVPVGVPSRHPRGLERLAAIARDSAAVLVLTTNEVRARVEGDARRTAALGSLACRLSSDLDQAGGADWDGPVPEPESLALLQYTSGSTSTPRGVMVTQSNLMHNSVAISACFGTGAQTRIVSWLPVFHDMGLAGSVLQTVFCGGSCTLMSSATFARDPATWLRAISDTGATVSGGPNFAYERVVEAVTPERRGEFDLSRWSIAFTGAEPVRGDTMRRFAAAFAPFGFRADAFTPCYGLAEATLMVSTRRPGVPVQVEPGADAGTEVVGCGTVVPGHRIEIVEPQRATACAPGETGEVWVQGPSVAGGYWHQPELSDELFGAHLAGDPAPFLRTGDLGYLRDGQLFITGRRKDLIIVRGRNHYPQDIEHTAELSHPALVTGGGAAFAVAAPQGDRLIVVHEAHRHADAAALASAVHRVRGDVALVHEVRLADVVLIRAGTLPRTSSGKVRRAECRRAYLAGELVVLFTDGGHGPDNTVGTAASGTPDVARPRLAIAPIRPADRSQRVLLVDADGTPRLPAAFHRSAASSSLLSGAAVATDDGCDTASADLGKVTPDQNSRSHRGGK
jgi:acyl-CoA synthetase (AMP-forming)/AMP-acid ligase II